MPNPGSLFTCRGPKTYAVSWRTESQIINSSYHKNSPDLVEGTGLPTTVDAFNAIPRRPPPPHIPPAPLGPNQYPTTRTNRTHPSKSKVSHRRTQETIQQTTLIYQRPSRKRLATRLLITSEQKEDSPSCG
jgi:hypothetical protein